MKNALFLFVFLSSVSWGATFSALGGGSANIQIINSPANTGGSFSQTLIGVCIDSTTVGLQAWLNPSDAQTDNELLYANATDPSPIPRPTHYLFCTSPGATIPSNAVIDGINIRWDISTIGAGSTSDAEIKLVKGNVIGATNKAGATWTATDTPTNYGGSADLWGDTWTPAQVNATDFGWVNAASVAGIGQIAQIDYQEATIYYHTPGTSPGQMQIQ